MRQMGLAFAFAVLFLVGCSGKHSMVDPEWKKAPDSYIVLVSRPFVGNPDDVADDLPEYTSNFEEWFSAEIATALERNFFTDSDSEFGSYQRSSRCSY